RAADPGRLSEARGLAIVDTASVPALPAPTVPQASGGELDGSLASATLSVPASAPLNSGDTVEGFFDGKTLGPKPATPGAALAFTIPSTMIVAARDKTVTVLYTVTRDGKPITSPTLNITVKDPMPSSFPAPRVPEAVGSSLDGSLASATLRVPATANLLTGDIVQAAFNGRDAGKKTVTTPGAVLNFDISQALIAGAAGRQVRVKYEVEREGKKVQSDVLTLTVTEGIEALPAPTVPESSSGQLDGGLTLATCRVPATAPLRAGDIVTGYFDAKDLGNRTVTIPGTAIDLSINGAMITAARGRRVDVDYTVKRGTLVVRSMLASVTVTAPVPALDFGPAHAMNCSGYVVAEGRAPRNPPANAVYTRTATGGTPPYTYRTSTPLVATVDSGGKVTACSNGSTNIIATDSSGKSALYSLSVSGAKVWRHRPSWGLVTYAEQSGISNAEGDLDRIAVNRAEIQELRNVYLPEGNPATVLGWLPNYMFTSEEAPNRNHYWGKEIGSGNEDQVLQTTRNAMLALVRPK
ncbi:MAG: Ig-like domain-containing protein, partial [Luteibacter sp.]